MVAQQERAAARHSRILDAALKIFSRRGYRDASVDDIASASATSKGGIYFHFPNKEDIFLKLLDRTADRLRQKVEEAMAAESEPIAKAEAALQALLIAFSKHRELARIFLLESQGAGRHFDQHLMAVHGGFAMLIQENLDRAIASGLIDPLDTDVASRVWYGALKEVITGWLLSERSDGLEDAYAALSPMLVRSVGLKDHRQSQR